MHNSSLGRYSHPEWEVAMQVTSMHGDPSKHILYTLEGDTRLRTPAVFCSDVFFSNQK